MVLFVERLMAQGVRCRVTDWLTDRHDNYHNPRCACTPRVNDTWYTFVYFGSARNMWTMTNSYIQLMRFIWGKTPTHRSLSDKIPVVRWLTYNWDPSAYSTRRQGHPEATITSCDCSDISLTWTVTMLLIAVILYHHRQCPVWNREASPLSGLS